MKPGTDAGERSRRRSPDIGTGWRIFLESGMLRGTLHTAGQAGELGRVRRFGRGIPRSEFPYNKLEHILQSRSEQGMGLHTARSKPQAGTEPGCSPAWSGTGMEPDPSP